MQFLNNIKQFILFALCSLHYTFGLEVNHLVKSFMGILKNSFSNRDFQTKFEKFSRNQIKIFAHFFFFTLAL